MFSAMLLTCSMHLPKCYHLLQIHTCAPPWGRLGRSPTSWREWSCANKSASESAEQVDKKNQTPNEDRSPAGWRKASYKVNTWEYFASKPCLIFCFHACSESKRIKKDLQWVELLLELLIQHLQRCRCILQCSSGFSSIPWQELWKYEHTNTPSKQWRWFPHFQILIMWCLHNQQQFILTL